MGDPLHSSSKWFGKLPRCATPKTMVAAGSTAVTDVLVMLKIVEQAGEPVHGVIGVPLEFMMNPLLSYVTPPQLEVKLASALVMFSSVQPPGPTLITYGPWPL